MDWEIPAYARRPPTLIGEYREPLWRVLRGGRLAFGGYAASGRLGIQALRPRDRAPNTIPPA